MNAWDVKIHGKQNDISTVSFEKMNWIWISCFAGWITSLAPLEHPDNGQIYL